MTVNQLIDALTRLVVHRQIKGDSEIRFANQYSNWALNGVYTLNDKVFVAFCKHNGEKSGENKKVVNTEK